LKTPDRN